MNNKNIPSGELKEGTAPAELSVSSSHEVAELKHQLFEMQMEILLLGKSSVSTGQIFFLMDMNQGIIH